MEPESILGIKGLQLGSISTWLLLLVSIPITWFIRGMSDRSKAKTAALLAEDDVIERQWKRFEEECERLRKQINGLEAKINKFQKEMDTLRKERDAERKLRNEAEAQVLKLESILTGRGEGRQMAAREHSAAAVGISLPPNTKGK